MEECNKFKVPLLEAINLPNVPFGVLEPRGALFPKSLNLSSAQRSDHQRLKKITDDEQSQVQNQQLEAIQSSID